MRALARAASVRPGEGRILALVALLFAALEAGRGFGEVGADTLAVGRFGPAILPYLFIGLGAVGMVASLAFGAALGRLPRTPLLVGIVVAASALLFAGRLVMASGTEAAIPFVWLVTYASGTIVGTISWAVAGSVFDARQAKRLFPLCTGAAIGGSFLGTLASGPVARAAGTETLIVIEAGLLVVVALLVVAIDRTGRVRVPTRRRGRSVAADLRTGFDEAVRSPLFRLVAIAYVLFSILFFSVAYPFFQVTSTTFENEADLATAIGLLSAAVTATSFVVSLVIANRVYARFGVATAALVLPIVYLAGFSLWLVQFSFATAALVRFTQQVTQRGLSNAAWSALYNVIPGDRRAQVLAFIDGVPGQFGMILSGLLLLGAGRLFAIEQVFWLGAITAVLLTGVVFAIRRVYGASLLRTLRSGLGEQVLEGGPGLGSLGSDPQVVTALVDAAGAADPVTRCIGLELLGRIGGRQASRMLVVGMSDEEAAVRATALEGYARWAGAPPKSIGVDDRILAGLGDADARVRTAAVRLVGRLAGPGDPATALRLAPLAADPDVAVRAAVAVALEDHPENTSPSVADLLADPSPDVRQAAMAAVAAVGGLAHGETIAPLLLAALDDDSLSVRRTAADLLAKRTVATDGLIDVLQHGSARAQDAAIRALAGHADEVRPSIAAWAERQVALATARRSDRATLDGTSGSEPPPPDTTLGFLSAVLANREGMLVDRVLAALAVLGAPEAGGVLRRCLRSTDPEVRAQALEALDTVGDRHLRRAVVGLLDADLGGATRDRQRVLDGLADDDDPWISRLARRAITESGGQQPMAGTARTLSDVDTMLLLRRIPLFQGLDPEDLQRIAATCLERVFPAGDALMNEDEIGDELLVILEGSVRVTRRQPDGSERFIRSYAAGDHIGELAVLRERPRVATVTAESDRVRTIVINGESLKAILRERPEAAMAMLATLAERISAQ